MASVAAIPNLRVYVHSIPYTLPIPSHPIGVTTHTHTQSTLEVTGGTQFSICLFFDHFQQPVWRTFPGNYVEIAVRLDGALVMHSCVPVREILHNGGRLCLTKFADGNTGNAKVPVFRSIETGKMNYLYTSHCLESC